VLLQPEKSQITLKTSSERGEVTRRLSVASCRSDESSRPPPPYGLKHQAILDPSAERKERVMTDLSVDQQTVEVDAALDQLGPVDYLIVEFPAGASSFTGEMAAELIALSDAGTIRVIDVLILTKNEDGSVDAAELSDIAELGPLQALEAQLAELLAEEDVLHLAASMDPGSVAGVLIWENLWAAPFASAVRRSGGQLIADGRIPIQAIIASIAADAAAETEGD
jgi:hypothetical protein